MKTLITRRSLWTKIRSVFSGAAAAVLLMAAVTAHGESPVKSVQGLWKYTGLTTSKGVEMPLTGIFLLVDGHFLQQSIFNSEPFSEAGVMGHSGYYGKSDSADIHLLAGQTLSVAPAEKSPLTNYGSSEHDLTVTRKGDKLTLVFGSGTEQRFDLIGDAKNAEVYPLAEGMLAFSGDYFILVNGNGEEAVSGYGKYSKDGDRLTLKVIRWSDATNGLAQNLKDVELSAHFDGNALVLADGRRFPVTDWSGLEQPRAE